MLSSYVWHKLHLHLHVILFVYSGPKNIWTLKFHLNMPERHCVRYQTSEVIIFNQKVLH